MDEAREILQDCLNRTDLGAHTSQWQAVMGIELLEVAVYLGDAVTARRLRDSLRELAPLSALRVDYTAPARHLGAASALLGEHEQARIYYEQSLAAASKLRFRPEIALTRLQMAELLLGEARAINRTEALAHLDFAIAEFREMKMQPSLERALRHKDMLKA